MGDKPYHDRETLRRLYHDEGMSQSEIADRFDVASNTISEWFSKLDITARPFEDAPHKSADVLRYLHHNEGMALTEMGERLGRNRETIRHWMEKHGIPRRDANRKRHTIPEGELRELYVDRQRSMEECGEHFGCTAPTIRSRLQEYGIPIRRDQRTVQRLRNGESVPYGMHETTGYPRWHDQISGRQAFVHQLLAVANGVDPHKVFSAADYVIHHKNVCEIDNRPDNIELLTNQQHTATHRRDEWVERDGWPELVTVDDPSEE